MRQLILLLLAVCAITFTSCRDDFEFEPSSGGLEFSKDTVYLDTVFTNIGSSTYTLKVYNRSDKDISIPSIKLGQGENSKYRLMVDGIPGKIFNNIELLAKDSMFVFIETTIDYSEYANNQTTFLYTDNIQFGSTTGTQTVELVTLVQDAYFLYPQRNDQGQYESVRYDSEGNTGDPVRIYGFYLDPADPNNGDEYHWNNTKPYVIYGYATVPNGQTLVVDPGARIHFHAESGLMVRPGARIQVNGLPSSDPEVLENEVIFEGDRLEPNFAGISGQWGTVLIMSAEENAINNLTLRNANIGIYAKAPDGDNTTVPKLAMHNVQLYNCTHFDLLAMHADIQGNNVVANNAGTAAIALTYGGNYSFKHCTFGNYFNSYQQVPLAINDYKDIGDTRYITAQNASFDNCIMYGSGNIALSLERTPENDDFDLRFNHCLIKLVDYSSALEGEELYPYPETPSPYAEYTGCVYAETTTQNRPNFEDPQNNKLNLFRPESTDNPGPEGAADPIIAEQINRDVTNRQRPLAPDTVADIGAYESTDAPVE